MTSAIQTAWARPTVKLQTLEALRWRGHKLAVATTKRTPVAPDLAALLQLS